MTKLTLPLEVGKKYVCRDGTIVDCYAKAGPEWKSGLVHICVADKPDQFKGTIWQDTGRKGTSGAEYLNDVVADYVEFTGHVHAELMAEYAKDAAKSTEPWKDWEMTDSFDTTSWISCTGHPGWISVLNYRRKPKTVTINGIVVNKGLTKADYDTLVYIPALDLHEKYFAIRFEDIYQRGLERGLVHATKEDAIAMADAMLACIQS